MAQQVGQIERKVVVIYFFHTNYAKYMVSLLRYPYNRLLVKNTSPQQNDSKRNIHSKKFIITNKSTVGQTTLTPPDDGLHNVFKDWLKKLGSLLSASRSR